LGVNGIVFSALTDSEAILLDGLFNLAFFVGMGLLILKVLQLIHLPDDDVHPGYMWWV
jgi:predicted Co/Zn/Cd cation transporter (cation efflux family)